MSTTINDSLKFTSEALPIILIICYLLFPSKFVEVSKHSLGKMIALFMMLYYYPAFGIPVFETGVWLLYLAASLTLWSMMIYIFRAIKSNVD